jgi:hypothetical protein
MSKYYAVVLHVPSLNMCWIPLFDYRNKRKLVADWKNGFHQYLSMAFEHMGIKDRLYKLPVMAYVVKHDWEIIPMGTAMKESSVGAFAHFPMASLDMYTCDKVEVGE